MNEIAFDEIPYDWLEPDTFVEVRPNYRTVGILPWPVKNLIIGQMLATGTIAAGSIVQVTRPEQAVALFGRGSIGAAMVQAFFLGNSTQPLFVMALADDVEAVKATGTFTFTGSVSSSVVLRALVNGTQVRFTVAAGDTVTQMASALKDAINANADLPVTASSAAGVVTVTSRHGGEVGNEIDLRMDLGAQPLPTGLGVAIGDMAGGTGNPDVQAALDVLENTWVTAVAMPWNDATNIGTFAAWLRERYTATAKLDVHGYVGKRGTFGQLTAWGVLTNCPFLSLAGLNRSPTASWEIAATVMGIASFHLANDPARQLRSLVVTGARSPDAGDQFTATENDLLLRSGVSTFRSLDDGTLTISRLITAYRQSNLGVADRAWMDIMVPATLSRIRYDWAMYVSLLYPRSKLVDDEDAGAFVGRIDDADEDPGNVVVTPRRMHASWAARCQLYADRVWIENVERTIRQSKFQRSGDDRNRLESRQQVQVVGNLMVLAAALEFQV